MLPLFKGVTMDLTSIESAIEELEDSPTTTENVSELASLYIVRENLFKTLQSSQSPEVLPHYQSYIENKRSYQLDQNTEGAVIKSLKNLCTDLTEFFNRLYSNTDMAKERRCITELIESFHQKYNS